MRRVGVLYIETGDVDIREQPSVYHAMYSFLNNRIFALEWGDFSKSRFLVEEGEDGVWRKLRPTQEDLHECRQAISAWTTQQEIERSWRA